MTAPVLDPTDENLRRAAECIRDGGVVVAPSDTNLALTLDPWNPEAVRRAYEIKDRPAHKPLTLFVRDPDDWRRYGTHDDPELVDALVDRFWPGPLNLVLSSTDRVSDERLQRDGTVAVGCLGNPTWRRLAALVDGPLAMTSANRSGTVDDDTLVDTDLAREHVGDGVDLIIDGEARGTTRASAILGLAGDPELLRRGDVSPADLRAVLGSDSL
ncbi:hypothetical protein C475_16069 [Halosimplex carlsbadense 2-9-1]|uniref:L-threonylcarbamoyladenylate synthase n=1 Tax=Halosimplex carlsbadense 2-9-1 TaxID=797114 RepID=M0CIX4_9EURY|nr:L-threonylcarbamoyladenylate synthase [Halosimplex carlsbadense]ELZ23181.1 hypothetical protein C475_16069 [Halosimplex carlsbadense 2-9-1]